MTDPVVSVIPYALIEPLPPGVVAANRLSDGLPRESSPWWMARLVGMMAAREPRLRKLRAYYRGEQDTWPLASEAARQTFGQAFRGLKANLAAPIVNALAQRLKVEAFRIPVSDPTDTEATETSDTEAWRIWQANGLDARSVIAHTEALALGECPISVAPNPADPRTPIITVEDPLQVIVERDPANPRRIVAALKRWMDPDGSWTAILYLPDRIEWWRSPRTPGRKAAGYGFASDTAFELLGRRWELVPEKSGKPPVDGVVPIVALVNMPRVDGSGQAEHESVLTLLDLLNKTLLDLATTSEFTAFPQRYALGVEVGSDEDAQADADGEPAASAIKTAVNRWITSAAPDATIGQLPPASLEPFTSAIAKIVELIGTTSMTPYHWLLNATGSVPSTGEALKAAERALDGKGEFAKVTFGEGWEEAMRLAFLVVADQERASTGSEVRWRPASSSSEAQHVDALAKLKGLDIIDDETILEAVPYGPEEITRIKARRAKAVVATTEQAEAYGAFIRAGVTPESARKAAGIPVALEHLGLPPVTVQAPDPAGPPASAPPFGSGDA